MSFNPLAFIPTGVADTTQINAFIATLNRLLVGFDSASQEVNESGPLTVTGVQTDIPGVTATINVTGSNAYCVAYYRVDVTATVTASNSVGQVFPVLDGASQNVGELVFDDRVSRNEPSGFLRMPLSPGSHTIKLQAVRGAGTFVINHGRMVIQTFDVT